MEDARKLAQTIARIGEQYRSATMGVLRISFLSSLVLELLASLSVAIIAVAMACQAGAWAAVLEFFKTLSFLRAGRD